MEQAQELVVPSWCTIDEVSLIITDAPNMPEMIRLAGTLGQFTKSLPFYLGDLLNGAESTFGEASSQITNYLGREYEYGTLANYKSTCARVTPATREILPSMGHCIVVARMDDAEQVRWLTIARDNEYTVAQLRAAIKAAKDGEEFDQFDDFRTKALRAAKTLHNLTDEAPTQKQLDLINQAAALVQEAANSIVASVGTSVDLEDDTENDE